MGAPTSSSATLFESADEDVGTPGNSIRAGSIVVPSMKNIWVCEVGEAGR